MRAALRSRRLLAVRAIPVLVVLLAGPSAGGNPAPFPADGRVLLVTESAEIQAVRPDGRNLDSVSGFRGSSPRVSPNGRWLVATRNGELWLQLFGGVTREPDVSQGKVEMRSGRRTDSDSRSFVVARSGDPSGFTRVETTLAVTGRHRAAAGCRRHRLVAGRAPPRVCGPSGASLGSRYLGSATSPARPRRPPGLFTAVVAAGNLGCFCRRGRPAHRAERAQRPRACPRAGRQRVRVVSRRAIPGYLEHPHLRVRRRSIDGCDLGELSVVRLLNGESRQPLRADALGAVFDWRPRLPGA